MTNKLTKMKMKKHKTGILFIVLLFLILLPFFYFSWVFISNYLDSRKPVIANRFKGDLNPAIKKEQLKNIDTLLAKIEGVQAHELHLKTATLRIYLDVNDDANEDTLKQKAQLAYQAVTSVLPNEKYFTKTQDKKMYDLEIHVYNVQNDKAENFIYLIETKNSAMKDPIQQIVSKPVDAKVAQSLRDEQKERDELRKVEKKKTVEEKDNSSNEVEKK